MKHTWRFLLSRHDEPAPPVVDPPVVDPVVDDADLGDAGKKALDAMKADRNAARAKATAAEKLATEQAAKLKAFEDKDKTDLEKLTAAKDESDKVAAKATARAVSAEVKATAADDWADPSDAALLLGDLAKYAKADGDVDVEAIKTDLAALIVAKPHLKKVAGPRIPAPDGSQGRGNNNTPTDFKTADKAAVDAEMAKLGLRPRS